MSSKFAKGDPYAKGSSAYMRSLLPPEPQLNLNVHDPAHVDQVVNFNPDPTLADKIFNSLYDPCASLASIACDHDITLETLTAWLARPDIAARLTNLEGACAMRLRLNTVNRLHLALDACTTILREYNDAACYEAAIREGKSSNAKEHIRRDRETARKTSLLMLRLATFDPTKPRRHNTRTRSNSNSETEAQTLQSRTGAAPIITASAFTGYSMTFAAPGFDQPTDSLSEQLPQSKYTTIETTATDLPTQPTSNHHHPPFDTAPISPIASVGPMGPLASSGPIPPIAPIPPTNAPAAPDSQIASSSEISNLKLAIAPAPVPHDTPAPLLDSDASSSRSERHTHSPDRQVRVKSAPPPEPAERAPQDTPETHARPTNNAPTPHTNHGNPARLNE